MGERNKEDDDKIVGGDRVTQMNLEDNLGDHTPCSHRINNSEKKDEVIPNVSSDLINFNDNSAELGYLGYYVE